MADLTHSLVAVIDAVKEKLENDDTLVVEDVFYGDQNLIPNVPAIALEGRTFTEEPGDSGMLTSTTFEVMVLVYHSSIEGAEKTRRDADLYAEQVASILNVGRQLDGLLIHSWVSTIEYGYALRNDTMMRAARITYLGVSRGRI